MTTAAPAPTKFPLPAAVAITGIAITSLAAAFCRKKETPLIFSIRFYPKNYYSLYQFPVSGTNGMHLLYP
jgi:hypothetical protein